MKQNKSKAARRTLIFGSMLIFTGGAFADSSGYAACVIRAGTAYTNCVSGGLHSQAFCDRQEAIDLAHCKGE